MGRTTLSSVLIGITLYWTGFADIAATEAGEATIASPAEDGTPTNCSNWTLDGYRLGMRGDELLSLRAVTLYAEGQAQAIEPGRFRGVLVLDGLNNLKKWDVIYQTKDGSVLRSEFSARFGKPISDVAGNISDNSPDAGRQRRTIWRNKICDVAIILYENTEGGGTTGSTVSATLIRASSLLPGLVEMKTLFH